MCRLLLCFMLIFSTPALGMDFAIDALPHVDQERLRGYFARIDQWPLRNATLHGSVGENGPATNLEVPFAEFCSPGPITMNRWTTVQGDFSIPQWSYPIYDIADEYISLTAPFGKLVILVNHWVRGVCRSSCFGAVFHPSQGAAIYLAMDLHTADRVARPGDRGWSRAGSYAIVGASLSPDVKEGAEVSPEIMAPLMRMLHGKD